VKTILAIVCLFLTLVTTAQAETLYVSDRLEITMRSGKSTSHGIIRMLRSGTPVEVLQVDEAEGYTKVRAQGKEGWVLSRYLMRGAAARDRLVEAEKKLAELELENRQLATSIQGLKGDKETLDKSRANLEAENRKIGQELAEIHRTASSALAIDNENKELKSRVVSLERDMQSLQQENQNLKDRTARDWFMVGAAVLLLGIIVGLIIPRIRLRKKSSWDTF
jgi:SH3 domain protein